MKFDELIAEGIEATGSLTALGNFLGLSQPRMSKIKRGKEHMPMMCSVKLADLISKDRFEVIVAAEIATSRSLEDQEFWIDIEQEMQSEPFREIKIDSYIRQIRKFIDRIPRTCPKPAPHLVAC